MCTEVIHMRKLILMILLAALCCTSAMAESGRIDDRLFNSAKQTLHCLDTGDYQIASGLLGCADSDALRTLVSGKFTTLGGGMAQTRISVAFFCNQLWYLAVPTAEPASAEVEVLLLNCGRGDGFLEVNHALWGDVEPMLESAEAVIWNEEYVPDVFVIMD